MNRRRKVTAAGAAALAAGAVAVVAVAAGGSEDTSGASSATAGTTTATVERRDLVEQEMLDGTLGYADERTVAGQGQGVITRLPAEGARRSRGESLYEVDGKPTAYLMYGSRPAWRRLDANASDGPDIRQLEQNLEALGYDPGTVDDDWSSATTDAVEEWQDDVGVAEDGAVDPGEVVFLPGRVRVGEVLAAVGAQAGGQVMKTTSTKRLVTVDLDAGKQRLVHRGDRVEVELPSGSTVQGRISEVGSVAKQPASSGDDQDQGDPTIDVEIELNRKAKTGTLDQAPVDVHVASRTAENVLAVPVTALLAREGSGYALELRDGASTRLLNVETGLFADGLVEVSGDGLREGMRVAAAPES